MSYENPRECKNCGKQVLYWNDKNKGGRPFDVTVHGPEPWHQCTEWKPAWKPKKPNVYEPQLRECKFGCGTDIIYNTAKGFFEENELNSNIEHICPNHPQGYEYDENGEKHQKKQTDHKPFVKSTPPQQQQQQQTTLPTITTTTYNKPPARQLEDLIREQNLILQGIAAQLQRVLDTLEVSARYQKASKDILQEYKDEVIDSIKNPPVSFESGVISSPTETFTPKTFDVRHNHVKSIQDDDDEDTDIYDELADTDDHSNEDLGGFKPSDTGSKNVRNDL